MQQGWLLDRGELSMCLAAVCLFWLYFGVYGGQTLIGTHYCASQVQAY